MGLERDVVLLCSRTIANGDHEEESQIAGLVVGLMAMALILGEVAATAWERWRQGLESAVERIQSRWYIALTCKVLSMLLVGLENRRPSVLGSVTSALCRIWVLEEGGRQICGQYRGGRTIRPCGSADMDWTLPPRAPSGLEDESVILYNWAMDRGATRGQCDRIVGLLSVQWMCSMPRPPRTRRKEGVCDSQWHRFLFRRHVQRILGWKERLAEGDPAGFSDAVNFLLRTKFFPDSDSKPDGEAAGAGQSRCPPPKSTIRSQCSTTRPGESGPGDGRMPTHRQPGRILPPWCTWDEQMGAVAIKRESLGESGYPVGDRHQLAVERAGKRQCPEAKTGKE